MTKAKEYPLDLMMVETRYGKKTIEPVKARETKDFYFVLNFSVETKYKKRNTVDDSKLLTDSSWGTHGDWSNSVEELYSLDAPIVKKIEAENLIKERNKAIAEKLQKLIKLNDYAKLTKVQDLLDELLNEKENKELN